MEELKYTNLDLNNGKRSFNCKICKQRCTSKRRILNHIALFHKDDKLELATGHKAESYLTHTTDKGEKKFQCKVCCKSLTTKQSIYRHLHRYHGKSPLSKVYGRYKDDPSYCIPSRTARRLLYAKSSANNCHETDQVSDSDDCDDDGVIKPLETHKILDEDNNEIGKNGSFEHLGLNSKGTDSLNDLNSTEQLGHDEQFFYSDNSSAEDSSDKSFDTDLESFCSESSFEYMTSGTDSSDNDIEDNGTTGMDQFKEPYSKEESFSLCISAYIARFNIPGDATKYLYKLLELNDGTSSSISNQKPIDTCSNFKRVSYCSLCYSVFEGDTYICQTNNCGNYRYKGGLLSQTSANRQEKTSFVIANIESQLKQILEKKDIWESVQEIKTKSKIPNTSVCDISDGEHYRYLCSPGNFLYNENNISAIFNTDGVPLYSSSNVKLWPIFLSINELPVHARFSRENIILAGIWQGKDKPPFLQYLSIFGREMCRLRDVGFIINPPGLQESINVKLGLLCGTVDLQAKAYILNMTMFNGPYGCSTCEEIGIVERQGRGHSRHYPYRDEDKRPPLRNSDDIKYVKGQNAKKTDRIKGICGVSGLSSMPWFDLVLGILPDYMHGVLMGVTKKMLYLWFSPTSTGQSYFIGKSLKIVSRRIQHISPPDYVERLPRDIERHYTNFKATELQTWLLFYSIPCLKGILPEEYHAHLCMLSEGVYLLLGDNITKKEISRAEVLLDTFYQLFAELYNKGSCGLNFHNVGVHLAFFVKKWGPLWAWSCFPFEDANAAVLNSVHGTGDVTRQCFRTKELQLMLKNIDLDRIVSEKEKLFINKTTKSSRPWKTTVMENCSITGRQISIGNCDIMDLLLEYTEASSADQLKKVYRVQVKGEKLYCKEYIRMKKRICYVVCTYQAEILSIQYFAINTVTKKVFAICDLLSTTPDCFFNTGSGRQIMKVEKVEDRPVIIPVNKIYEKVFYMDIEGNVYIARMPNLCGHCVFK